MRQELSNELVEVINEFGPQLYDDFDKVTSAIFYNKNFAHLTRVSWQWRILVPSASVPPSSGTPGLWRRKSGTGAVDAQGNLLVHPMVSAEIGSPCAPASYLSRHGWMNVCSGGAVVRSVGPAHGLVPRVARTSAAHPPPMPPMTKIRVTTITFSAFFQERGSLHPTAIDHEATIALTQTFRSSA